MPLPELTGNIAISADTTGFKEVDRAISATDSSLARSQSNLDAYGSRVTELSDELARMGQSSTSEIGSLSQSLEGLQNLFASSGDLQDLFRLPAGTLNQLENYRDAVRESVAVNKEYAGVLENLPLEKQANAFNAIALAEEEARREGQLLFEQLSALSRTLESELAPIDLGGLLGDTEGGASGFEYTSEQVREMEDVLNSTRGAVTDLGEALETSGKRAGEVWQLSKDALTQTRDAVASQAEGYRGTAGTTGPDAAALEAASAATKNLAESQKQLNEAVADPNLDVAESKIRKLVDTTAELGETTDSVASASAESYRQMAEALSNIRYGENTKQFTSLDTGRFVSRASVEEQYQTIQQSGQLVEGIAATMSSPAMQAGAEAVDMSTEAFGRFQEAAKGSLDEITEYGDHVSGVLDELVGGFASGVSQLPNGEIFSDAEVENARGLVDNMQVLGDQMRETLEDSSLSGQEIVERMGGFATAAQGLALHAKDAAGDRGAGIQTVVDQLDNIIQTTNQFSASVRTSGIEAQGQAVEGLGESYKQAETDIRESADSIRQSSTDVEDAARVIGDRPTLDNPDFKPTTGDTTGLETLGSDVGRDIVQGYYDAMYQSIQETGRLRREESGSLLDQVYESLVGQGAPRAADTFDLAADIVSRAGSDASEATRIFREEGEQLAAAIASIRAETEGLAVATAQGTGDELASSLQEGTQAANDLAEAERDVAEATRFANEAQAEQRDNLGITATGAEPDVNAQIEARKAALATTQETVIAQDAVADSAGKAAEKAVALTEALSEAGATGVDAMGEVAKKADEVSASSPEILAQSFDKVTESTERSRVASEEYISALTRINDLPTGQQEEARRVALTQLLDVQRQEGALIGENTEKLRQQAEVVSSAPTVEGAGEALKDQAKAQDDMAESAKKAAVAVVDLAEKQDVLAEMDRNSYENAALLAKAIREKTAAAKEAADTLGPITETEGLMISGFSASNPLDVIANAPSGSIVSEEFYDNLKPKIAALEESIYGVVRAANDLPEDAFQQDDIDTDRLEILVDLLKSPEGQFQGITTTLDTIRTKVDEWNEAGLKVPITLEKSLEKLEIINQRIKEINANEGLKSRAIEDLEAGDDPEGVLARLSFSPLQDIEAFRTNKQGGAILDEAIARLGQGTEPAGQVIDDYISRMAELEKSAEPMVGLFQRTAEKLKDVKGGAEEAGSAFGKMASQIQTGQGPLGAVTRLLVPYRYRAIASTVLRLGGSFTAVAAAVGVAVVAVNQYIKAMERIEERRKQLEDLKDTFGDVSAAIEDVQDGLDGLGSEKDVESILGSVDEDSIVATSGKLEEIAVISKRAARDTGQSWQEVMPIIIDAIEAGNGALLEEMDIIDDASAVISDYASALGLPVSKLQDWQKEQALFDAALAKSANAVDDPLSAFQEYEEGIQSIGAAVADARRVIGDNIADALGLEGGAAALNFLAIAARDAAAGLRDFTAAQKERDAIRSAAKGTGSEDVENLASELVKMDILVEQAAQETRNTRQFANIGDAIIPFASPFSEGAEKEEKLARQALERYREVTEEIRRQMEETGEVDPAILGDLEEVFTSLTGVYGEFSMGGREVEERAAGIKAALADQFTGDDTAVQNIRDTRDAMEELEAAQVALFEAAEGRGRGNVSEEEFNRAKYIAEEAKALYDLAEATAQESQAQSNYNDAIRSGTEGEIALAAALLVSGEEIRSAAAAKLLLVQYTEDLNAATAEQAAAMSEGDGAAAALLQTEINLIQGKIDLMTAAYLAATGLDVETGALMESGQATEQLSERTQMLRTVFGETATSVDYLIGSVNGLPTDLDLAAISMGDAADKSELLEKRLKGLRDAFNEASYAAQSSAFSDAFALLPYLGGQGTVAKAGEFAAEEKTRRDRAQAEQAKMFQETGMMLDPALVEAQLNQIGSTKRNEEIKKIREGFEGLGESMESVAEKISDAMDTMISAMLKPTTAGLTGDDGENLVDKWLGEGASGGDEFVDTPAREALDVLKLGKDSPHYENIKNMFPKEEAAMAADDFYRFIAQKIKDHNEGLSFELFDTDYIADQAIKDIKGAKAKADFVDTLTPEVLARAEAEGITEQDLRDHFLPEGDKQAKAVGKAVGKAMEEAFFEVWANPELAEKMGLLIPAPGANPLSDEDEEAIKSTATKASEEAGEAYVVQTESGNYGHRSVNALLFQMSSEASKKKMAGAGSNLADWMGASMTARFAETVPPELLSILVDDLVPLIIAALAAGASADGGGGTGGGNNGGVER